MTKKRVQTLLIVWMAVSALLLSTACSRKSSQKTPPKAIQATAPISTELDDDSSRSSQDDQDADDSPVVDQPSNDSGAPTIDESNASAPTLDEAPVAVRYDTTGMTPSEIFADSARQGVSRKGERSSLTAEGVSLFHSGSGQDDLRERILDFINAKEDSARKESDKRFAKSIGQIAFDANYASGTAHIQIVMKKAGEIRKYDLSGALSSDLILRSGSVRRGNRIALEAACMDLDGGCQTVYMKIQDGSGGRVRTAHAIVRSTPVALFTEAQGYNIARNENYNYFLNLLLNTADLSGPNNKVNSLVLRTSEVINGESNFIVQMGLTTTHLGNGSLNWGGSLVKQEASDAVGTRVELLQNSTSRIVPTIVETRLVRNDGRGNIQLAVTMARDKSIAHEDTLLLTLSRQHKPVRELHLK